MKKALSVLTILVAVQLAVPLLIVEARREDVKRVLKRLEEDTDRFSKSLDSALERAERHES